MRKIFMPQLEEQVLDNLRTLTNAQQQEVLNFILFLNQQRQRNIAQTTDSSTFITAAQRYVGCLEGGPSDLSTNPKYMEGFGE
jgi:uncharacterized membrane protein YgcG